MEAAIPLFGDDSASVEADSGFCAACGLVCKLRVFATQ
jgi:hypothetical protein